MPSQEPTPREELDECRPGKVPKRKRGECRQGYFRETPTSTTFKTWSRRKCGGKPKLVK